MKQGFKLIAAFMLIFIAVSVLTLHKKHFNAAVCLGVAIEPEREIIEVYEERINRPNDLSATEYGIVTGSVRTALTMTQKGGEDESAEYGILRSAPFGDEVALGYAALARLTQNDIIILTADERAVVELAVMSEAGCESQAGQRLVAECIYNAAVHDGISIFEVLERYQYALRDDVTATESVKEAVAAVFDRGEHITDEPIMFFYNPDITSCRWHETLCYVLTEGRHRFFKLW